MHVQEDVSYFTVKSILSICALEASNFHILPVYAKCWTRIGFQTIYDVTNNSRRPASKNQIFNEHRTFYTFSNECEDSLLQSNSAHTLHHSTQ